MYIHTYTCVLVCAHLSIIYIHILTHRCSLKTYIHAYIYVCIYQGIAFFPIFISFILSQFVLISPFPLDLTIPAVYLKLKRRIFSPQHSHSFQTLPARPVMIMFIVLERWTYRQKDIHHTCRI